jgi:hypothetical protein
MRSCFARETRRPDRALADTSHGRTPGALAYQALASAARRRSESTGAALPDNRGPSRAGVSGCQLRHMLSAKGHTRRLGDGGHGKGGRRREFGMDGWPGKSCSRGLTSASSSRSARCRSVLCQCTGRRDFAAPPRSQRARNARGDVWRGAANIRASRRSTRSKREFITTRRARRLRPVAGRPDALARSRVAIGRSSVAACQPERRRAASESEARNSLRRCVWRRTSAWGSRSSTVCAAR